MYVLVRKREVPCYKNGKKLYFFKDKLLVWIEKGRKRTKLEIQEEVDTWLNSRKNIYEKAQNNKRK